MYMYIHIYNKNTQLFNKCLKFSNYPCGPCKHLFFMLHEI